MDHTENTEQELQRRRARRRAEERRRRRRKKRIIRDLVLAGMALLLVLLIWLAVWGIKALCSKTAAQTPQTTQEETLPQETEKKEEKPAEAETPETEPEAEGSVDFSGEVTADPLPASYQPGFTAVPAEDVKAPDEEQMTSTNAILINASNGTITVQKDAKVKIYPASMTKILTVLVAAEHVKDLDEKVQITQEVTDYAYSHDCSIVGYKVGDEAPVRDLFYGTILPSGADAATALAIHVAGSEEAFADMMNEKVKELGLAETTHFTNCVGLYDDNHYSTAYDMAMILKAAIENDWCRQVLSTHRYTTAPTSEHPEGIELSNWFLRRIEDKDSGGTVQCAKTGFVNQSGNCAASYEVSAAGTPYICVTVNAHSSWRCIYDHVAMYKLYAVD